MSAAMRRAVVGAVCLSLFLPSTAAHGHQAPSGWTYPFECCSGTGDCAPIDGRLVRERTDGWHVTVPRGAHPTRPWFEGSQVFRRDDAVRLRRSGDQHFHLCIGTGGEWRCLYVPLGVT